MPAWATFNTWTGELKGTPALDDVGITAEIEIAVSDGVSRATVGPFRITVTAPTTPVPPAEPPTISGVPAAGVVAGQPYLFVPVASDPNNDALTFLIVNRPSWATFNTNTGQLSGTPTSANVGGYANIVIGASNGALTASLTAFTITVSSVATPPPVDNPPVISGTPSTSITVGSAYSFVPTANDPEGQPLTFSIQNQPSWMSFSAATGELSGTPAAGNVGSFANITISVSDGTLSASLAPFTLTVNAAPPPPVDGPPTISGAPPTSVTAGSAYSFTPTATDPEGHALTFSIQNQPAWATFSSVTGRLSGTPSSANVGSFANITISVSNGTLSASLPAFTLTVNAAAPPPPPPDGPPTITGTPATSVTVGSAYDFTPSATDPQGHALTFSAQNVPSWMNFSTLTGELSGTPSSANVGSFANITVGVSNGTLSASLPAFTLTVNVAALPPPPPDGPPTITGTPATSVTVGSAYDFTPSATDPEGHALTFSVQNQPAWANFSSSTGRLFGTPTVVNIGSFANITISVSNGTLSASLPAFTIVVNALPLPPVISGTPPASIAAATAYAFTPTASGPAGDTLTFSIANKPSWATFSTTTGELSGTPASADVGSDSDIIISVGDGTLSAALPAFTITVTAQVTTPPSTPPIVLYTDITSGPNSGGENNEGAYLSVFGKNFGSTLSGVHVYIGSAEINNYRYLGASLGRTDVEEITVQIGAVGSPTPGTALPVTVVVGGVTSNANVTFTVNPGRILFASLSGDDSTAVAGDITHPYRHVQTSSNGGAFGAMKAGDIVVMRAGNWTDLGNGNYFMKVIDLVGTAPSGASGSGPLTFMAYPTEDVQITETSSASGGISGVDAQSYTGGKWVTIADLHVESGGSAGVINAQIASDHWRTVNNELTAAGATNNTLAGGITGNGTNAFWVGNHIHNIAGGSNQENHGIYIDGDGSYEVAYNVIETVTGGNGFQAYNDGTNGSSSTSNINLHHNLIHDISKHGINIADNTASGVQVWDNIVYNIAFSGIRINSNLLTGCKIYNNTIYAVDTGNHSGYAAMSNDETLAANALDVENNIFYPNGTAYVGGDTGFGGSHGTVTNNLFFGGTGGTLGSNPVTANPNFLNAATDDLHLTSGSPAIGAGAAAVSGVVVTDYDLNPASAPFDIGAYQFQK